MLMDLFIFTSHEFCFKLFLRYLSKNELVEPIPHILGNLSYIVNVTNQKWSPDSSRNISGCR